MSMAEQPKMPSRFRFSSVCEMQSTSRKTRRLRKKAELMDCQVKSTRKKVK